MEAERIFRGNASITGVLCGLITVLSFLAGFLFFPLWLLTLIFGLGWAAQPKPCHICGNCGNQVAATSVLCPTCHAELTVNYSRSFTRGVVRMGWVILIGGFLLVFAWCAWRGIP